MKQALRKKWIPVLLAAFLFTGCLIHFPTLTYAAGVSIDPSAYTVYVGDSVTVTVTLYGSEIYAYSGYIDCDGVLSGDSGGFADGADGSGSVSLSFTYYATAEGSGSVYVSDCVVSDGDTKEDAGGGVCTINVIGRSNGGGGGTGGNAGGWDYDDDEVINGYEVGEGSDNTNLAKLEVEGYTLVDEGYDIYSVSVSSSAKTINIIAVPEDENAYVFGDGEQILEEGDNQFELYVYAENGYIRGYLINVTRRGDKIALSDLANELKETKEEAVTIALKDGDKLTKEMISALAKWGKTLHLNKYDKDGKLLYGWTLIGKDVADLQGFETFDPAIRFGSNKADQIDELSNYAAGITLDFAYSGDLPKNTLVTIPTGDVFSKDDIVYLYYFDEAENKLTAVGEPITVKGDTIDLPITHCSSYLLTRANLAPKEEVKKEGFSFRELIMIAVIGVALIVIIILIILLSKKRKNGKKTKQEVEPEPLDDLDELDRIIEQKKPETTAEPVSNKQVAGLFEKEDSWADDDYETTDLR